MRLCSGKIKSFSSTFSLKPTFQHFMPWCDAQQMRFVSRCLRLQQVYVCARSSSSIHCTFVTLYRLEFEGIKCWMRDKVDWIKRKLRDRPNESQSWVYLETRNCAHTCWDKTFLKLGISSLIHWNLGGMGSLYGVTKVHTTFGTFLF